MGSETALWKCFKKNMQPYGTYDRHEDKLNLGVPDVSYVMFNGICSGWIELKHAHKYPVRSTTDFKLSHYTQDQRNWLRRRGTAGDDCWLLLQVNRDYWLFDWHGAQQVGRWPWVQTSRYAVRGWVGGMNWAELASTLVIYRRTLLK